MSAGGEASVRLADVSAFNSMCNDINGLEEGYTTTAVIDGNIIQGWVLVDTQPPLVGDSYRIVLRRPVDDSIGTAEYIGVLISDDGYITEVCQYVLIQNDNDYEDSGFERFTALWMSHVR